MRGLKKYCGAFGWEFVDQPQDAEVIITNDVYPKHILALNKPMVKRMDGVYWDNRLKERNEPLNTAALASDSIIFISEYSKRSFVELYKTSIFPKPCHVIPNCVDDSVYFPLPKRVSGFITWIASASNWSREEKRFEDLMVFADVVMDKGDTLVIIGQCDNVPDTIKIWPAGYVDDETEVNKILNSGHAFINLSYRDPAPKVVCQAVNCKLPILYANSGGTPEMVNVGVPIRDNNEMVFEDRVPRLKLKDMRAAYIDFRSNYRILREKSNSRKPCGYMEMLSEYFWVMHNTIYEHKVKDEAE